MRFRPAILLLACSMPSAYASESSNSSHLHNVWYRGSLRASSLSPEQLAQSFLTSKAEELGVSPKALKLVKKQESLLSYHMVYQQNVNDLPIANATVSVSILKHEGAVYQYYSTLINTAATPVMKKTISLEQAYDAAWAYIGVTDQLFQAPKSLLHFVETDEGLKLVYSVDLSPKAPYGAWQVDIDASTADVINVRDLRVNEKAIPIPSTFGNKVPTINRQSAFDSWKNGLKEAEIPAESKSGNAQVFDPDPKTEMGNDTISDSSPASTFEKAYVQRILPDISLSNGVYKLAGPWAKIIDFDPPTAAPSTTKDGVWKFTRGQEGFTDAMTYFHLDQSQRYIQSLGFKDATGIQFGPMEADADGANGDDNSYFMPSTNRLAFGHGCVDDNEDSDVILHEYGHALHYSINPNWGGGDTGAMGEGFGDYWAASYSYSSIKGQLFHPERVYNWDAGGCWPGRGLDAVDAKYDFGTSYSAHSSITGGRQSDELWSTPLFQAHMALRALDIPRSEIDTIVLEAQFGLGSSLKMRDMAQSIVATARRLYPDGQHAEIFRQKFVAQGILLEPKSVLVASLGTIEGEDAILDPGEDAIIPLKIENAGNKLAEAVALSIKSDDTNISDLSAEFTLGNIAAGKSSSVKLNFKLSADAPCGHMVELQLILKAKDGKSSVVPLKVLVGKAIEASVANTPKIAIPDKGAAISDTIVLASTADVSSNFTVDLNITHPYIADLKVSLISATGKELILHNRTGYSDDNIIGTYPKPLQPYESFDAYLGTKLEGTWTLKVQDVVSGDAGTLVSWGIRDVSGYECR